MERSCENSVANINQPQEELLQAAQCPAAADLLWGEEFLPNFQGRTVKCNGISPLVRYSVPMES